MKEHLDRIRQILNDLEVQALKNHASENGSDFAASELPLIIREIVDDLQPLLTPYEAAFYWYVFRHSIAESGSSLVRVSTRKLQTAAVKSSYANQEDGEISLAKVREVLTALESIGAIRKDGEPNRDGTLYRVFVPNEIGRCQKFRSERSDVGVKSEVSEKDVDYYNIPENRIKVYERDGYKCQYCQKQLTLSTVTLDHLKAVSEGGDNSFENLLTACRNCNSKKIGKTVGDFLADQTG